MGTLCANCLCSNSIPSSYAYTRILNANNQHFRYIFLPGNWINLKIDVCRDTRRRIRANTFLFAFLFHRIITKVLFLIIHRIQCFVLAYIGISDKNYKNFLYQPTKWLISHNFYCIFPRITNICLHIKRVKKIYILFLSCTKS